MCPSGNVPRHLETCLLQISLCGKKLKTSGQMLAPRAGHTTVILGNKLFYLGVFTDTMNLYEDLLVLNIDMPEENGPKENGQSKLEKSSVRRMLNNCRESNLLAKEPGKSNDVPYIGFMSDLSHPMDLQAHSQADDSKSAADVLFEGKITDVMQKGYAIETIINGKVLRGMLFPSTTSSIQDGHAYPHKRRTNLNERRPLSTAVQIMPQDTKISYQIVATCAKESMNETVIVEPATMLSQDLKIDAKKLELSAMPNQELNNVSENLEPLLTPSEIVKNDDVSDESQKTGAYEHRFQVEDHEKIDMDKCRDQM